jgi:hypothetical protein
MLYKNIALAYVITSLKTSLSHRISLYVSFHQKCKFTTNVIIYILPEYLRVKQLQK